MKTKLSDESGEYPQETPEEGPAETVIGLIPVGILVLLAIIFLAVSINFYQFADPISVSSGAAYATLLAGALIIRWLVKTFHLHV